MTNITMIRIEVKPPVKVLYSLSPQYRIKLLVGKRSKKRTDFKNIDFSKATEQVLARGIPYVDYRDIFKKKINR